jgi:ClpP class serine protease
MIEDIWLGSEARHKLYLSELARFEERVFPQISLRETVDDYGANPVTVEKAGEFAFITISGDTVKDTTWYTRWRGFPTYQDMHESIDNVEGDSAIKFAIFVINTYGGQAAGVNKLANRISKMQKTTVSFTPENQKSAGMWYGSACDIHVADPDASLGSIGVIAQLFTQEKRLEMKGISVHTERSVPGKQVINPNEALSDAGKALLRKGVMDIHNDFEKAMSGYLGIDRKVFSETIATGAEFTAKEALQVGLINYIMPLEELVKKLAKLKGK